MYLVGNITITLSVNFGTTLFFVACVNVFEKEDGTGVLEGKAYQVYLIFLGITLLANAVSALGNKWLPWLDVSAPENESFSDRVWKLTAQDCCHLLDLCWRHCHHHYCPRYGQGGSTQREIRLRPLRVQLWMD